MVGGRSGRPFRPTMPAARSERARADPSRPARRSSTPAVARSSASAGFDVSLVVDEKPGDVGALFGQDGPVIPEEFHPLLKSPALALVSTLGPGGAPQATPLWFLFEGGHVRFSLVKGRQKLRNPRRDPCS